MSNKKRNIPPKRTEWSGSKPTDLPPYPEYNDNEFIDSNSVGREYERLYDYLKKEKAKADAAKKPMIILAGEVHNNRNSLLIEYMLVDIASRLGISNFADEKDATVIKLWEEGAGDASRLQSRIMRAMPSVQESKTFMPDAACLEFLGVLQHYPIYDVNREPAIVNPNLALYMAKSKGMTCHAGDPLYQERISTLKRDDVTDDEIFDDKYETAMQNALLKVAKNGGCIAINGAGHVPELCKRLNGKGLHAVGVDCTADYKVRPKNDAP